MTLSSGILGSGLKPEQPIYRTIPLVRLKQMLEQKQNVLVRPRKWPDTFEDLLGRSELIIANGYRAKFRTDNIFGQCWTLHTASDAIWQIYSKDRDGFRIRTTAGRLLASIRGQVPDSEYRCYIGRVSYLSDHELRRFGRTHFTDPNASPSEAIAEAFLVKRKAFEHEREARLIYQAPESTESVDLFSYRIDPNFLIDQIMVHPMVSYQEYKDFRTAFLAMGFTGAIKRSLLYQEPRGFTFKFGPT